MKNWFEAIQKEDVLVVWELSGFSRDEQREICQLLSVLPVSKLVVLGNAEDLMPVFIEAGRVPVVGRANSIDPGASNQIQLIEITETSQLYDPFVKESLQRWMCNSPKILLGVDSTASWLRQLYQGGTIALGEHFPPGVMFPQHTPAEGFKRFYERNFTQVLENDPIEWLRKVGKGHDQAEKNLPDSKADTLKDQEPYMFLDSYEQADATLFYGRRSEIRALAELAISSQLTVLFGPSGVGKTSLIGAGLLPLLAKNDIVGIQVRIATDSSWGLSGAIVNQIVPNLEMNFIDQLATLADSTGKLLVVIFDQLEELFTLANPAISESFARSVKEAQIKIPAPIHFIFSIREDYLAQLAELRSQLPRMLDRTFRLEPLNTRQAYEVIVEPAEKCGYRFESELADTMIVDLLEEKQSIDPVDLQVICYRLLSAIKQKEARTFLFQDYQSLGRAETILADFLENVTARGDCPAGAMDVLKSLTTSAGTKVFLTQAQLAQDARLTVAQAEEITRWLERPFRLVRLAQTPQGETGVELRHDVLARRILDWITNPEELRAKQIKDLIRMELQGYNRMGLLPSRAKFQQIDAERENPHLILRTDELVLLIKTAFRFSEQLDAWLTRLPELEREAVLLQALEEPEETVRRKAISLLPKQKSLDFLIAAYEKLEEEERIQHLRTLSWLGERLAWPALEDYRLDASRNVRSVVWSLLFELNNARATALRNAEQKRFLFASGVVTWLMVLMFALVKDRTIAVLDASWLIFISSTVLLAGFALLGNKIPRMVSRALAILLITSLCYLLVGAWGLLVALVIILGLGANLSNGSAALLGFTPLMLLAWDRIEQVVWILPFVLAVYATLALTRFSHHLLRRDRMVSWILVSAGFIWLIFSTFDNLYELQVVMLVYLCGVSFGQVFERASILDDPHGARFSYVLNLIQKTWSLLHQIPANFRSGLGWVTGTAWAGVMLYITAGKADIVDLFWIGCAFLITTWFTNGNWYWIISFLLTGTVIGLLVGNWTWASGIFLLSSVYLVTARIFQPSHDRLQTNRISDRKGK